MLQKLLKMPRKRKISRAAKRRAKRRKKAIEKTFDKDAEVQEEISTFYMFMGEGHMSMNHGVRINLSSNLKEGSIDFGYNKCSNGCYYESCMCDDDVIPEYWSDEIDKFCDHLNPPGSTYEVAYDYFMSNSSIPLELTNLFNIVKSSSCDRDNQLWTYKGRGLT